MVLLSLKVIHDFCSVSTINRHVYIHNMKSGNIRIYLGYHPTGESQMGKK